MIIEKTNWQVVVVCYFMQIETQSRLNVVIKIVKGFIETLFNEKRPFYLFLFSLMIFEEGEVILALPDIKSILKI